MAARENFIPEKRRGASCSDTYVFPGNKFLVFLVSRSACLQPIQGCCGPVHSLRGSRAGPEARQGQLRQVSDSKTNFYFAKKLFNFLSLTSLTNHLFQLLTNVIFQKTSTF